MAGGPDDPFNQCPKFAELADHPQGPGKGGPMTTMLFHADPYVAGPYVEGDYDVELPVSAALHRRAEARISLELRRPR